VPSSPLPVATGKCILFRSLRICCISERVCCNESNGPQSAKVLKIEVDECSSGSRLVIVVGKEEVVE